MHVARRTSLFGKTIIGLAIAAWFGLLAGCAPIRGYPDDPENTDATLVALTPYFNGVKEVDYLSTSDPALRMAKRDAIVLARIRAYDIEFAGFERRLYGDGNAVNLSSDLAGLVLAGLIATTGNAGTKAALGAAAGGVLGANSAMNRDLYYQKTIPALLAQMEADRLKALTPITTGLKASDADYPLMRAYIDLDTYKNAGSIPGAITSINQSAADVKDAILLQAVSGPDQQKNVQTVQAQLKSLSDAQYLALAQKMQINLFSRSPALQQTINQVDSKALRLTNGAAARRVINIWVEQDDVSAANVQQWLTAIASVLVGK
jgi:hypothetical protein